MMKTVQRVRRLAARAVCALAIPLACATVAGAASGRSSHVAAQSKLSIPVGMWAGKVTGTNGATIDVSYEVKAVDDKLVMVSHSMSGRLVELGEIRMAGDTMRFLLAPGTKIECTMVRKPAGTYNGGCTDGKLEPAPFILTPPASAAPAATVNPVPDLYRNLRNFVAQQEIYYSNPANGYSYASDAGKAGFTPDPGITLTVLEASTKGWSAIVRAPAASCVIYLGEVAKIPVTPRGTTAASSGSISCDPAPGK